jgi:TolA-binding protein
LKKPCRVIAARLFCLSAALSLTSCATREDVRTLQEDIKGTKTYIESNVQPGQADIYSTVQNLTSSLEALKAEIQSNRETSAVLAGKMDDLQASLTARLDALYELLAGSKFVGSAEPGTLFNLASSDMARSRYDSAIEGFRRYLERTPSAGKAAEATLRIGECQARLRKWAEAAAQFDRFISSYPSDSLISSAAFDKAQVLEQTGQLQSAIDLYKVIVQKYPSRPEAPLAQDRLKALQSSSGQPH